MGTGGRLPRIDTGRPSPKEGSRERFPTQANAGVSRRAFAAKTIRNLGLIWLAQRVIGSHRFLGPGDSKLTSALASEAVIDFRVLPNRTGWGPMWCLYHYGRFWNVRGGRAELRIPGGLASTAPAQPMPVFFLDHDCGDSIQRLTFRVTNPAMRPGLLFRCQGPHSYYAVTAEGNHLVLARYERTSRAIIRRAETGRLGSANWYQLLISVSGKRIRAKLWRVGSRSPGWQLDAGLGDQYRQGANGVLVVHPQNLRQGSLFLRRFSVKSPETFGPTPPKISLALTGTPVRRPDGSVQVALRAASAFPATIKFEWTNDVSWTGDIQSSPELDAKVGPRTVTHSVVIPPGRDLFWRARAESASTGEGTTSSVKSLQPHRQGRGVVIAAASCAQLWRKPSYQGIQRAVEAGGGLLDAFVYQGDLGYAQNSFRSCYKLAPDFFADRFFRFLGDPYFTDLRNRMPVSFTIDDHDYGANNGSASDILPWTVGLWNKFHADPSQSGYYDFRLGDVHCLTLDGRRYSDSPLKPNGPGKTKLGDNQFSWMRGILETSDAKLFVIFSADIFASRKGSLDCFLFGWPHEYRKVMTVFMNAQLRGKRVVVVSGDAHGLRLHYHRDPQGRPEARGLSIVEFIACGLEARTWSGAESGDQTLDASRNVSGTSGLGLITIDPPSAASRKVTLRAIASHPEDPLDLFEPLHIPFEPVAGGEAAPAMALARPSSARRVGHE